MDKKTRLSAISRDERAIALPLRLPTARALESLKRAILEMLASGDSTGIDAVCREKLLPLLDAQTELAFLKGGRRAELAAEKVVNESVSEFAPVKFSLSDNSDSRARGTIDYLRKIIGIDPSKAKTHFQKHNAGAIGDLSDAICAEVKQAVKTLAENGVHIRGGKAEIARVLNANGVQVLNTTALAETLFRTQSQQAYAAGRWTAAHDSDFGDEIWGFEYVTVGDDRVREGHRVLEGVRLPKEDPFWQKYFPPNGWNCRCTTLEIWRDDPEAVVHFGITGRDPRKRTADDMNVPKEFRGNVGVFAVGKPKKEEPAPAPESFPSTVRPVTQRDCINALLAIQRFYSNEEVQEVKVVPTPTGCDVFLRGKFLTSIQAETNNDVHYSREPSRTFCTRIGGVRKVFRNLTDALISVLKGKVGGK